VPQRSLPNSTKDVWKPLMKNIPQFKVHLSLSDTTSLTKVSKDSEFQVTTEEYVSLDVVLSYDIRSKTNNYC
jgi:hypothetical protein